MFVIANKVVSTLENVQVVKLGSDIAFCTGGRPDFRAECKSKTVAEQAMKAFGDAVVSGAKVFDFRIYE